MVLGAPPAAILGAYAGDRLRIPAGSFTGAMAGVGILLAFMGLPEIRTPPLLNQVLQVLVGVLVGLRISRESLASGARTVLPATALAALFLASSVIAAGVAVGLTGMSPVTAIFAAAPGGLTEMATIGAGLGADGPAVAAIHLSRLLLVIFAASLLLTRARSDHPNPDTPERYEGRAREPRDHALVRLGLIAATGLAGGILGFALTPLPAGGVLGSLLGAGLARFFVRGPVPERGFNLIVQVSGGGIIGLGFSAEFFATLVQLAGAALVINAAQMLVWVLAAYLLVKAFRLDRETAAFAAAPGGMGTLLSITGGTDADLVRVAFTHLFRLSATIVVVPLLVTTMLG